MDAFRGSVRLYTVKAPVHWLDATRFAGSKRTSNCSSCQQPSLLSLTRQSTACTHSNVFTHFHPRTYFYTECEKTVVPPAFKFFTEFYWIFAHRQKFARKKLFSIDPIDFSVNLIISDFWGKKKCTRRRKNDAAGALERTTIAWLANYNNEYTILFRSNEIAEHMH